MANENLWYRCGTALLDVVRTLAGTHAPGVKKFYARDALAFDGSRDGVPAVVICPTPNSPTSRTHGISSRDVAYPWTVTVFAAADKCLARGPDWQSGFVDALGDAMSGSKLAAVPECLRVWVDDSVVIDTSAWEQANLYAAPVNLRVLCRLPARKTP